LPVILALDIGERRTGLAVGSTESRLARPHSVLHHSTRKRDILRLKQVISEVGASLLLVGCPASPDGSMNPQAERVVRYARSLAEELGLPLQLWNEAYSSEVAKERLLAAGRSRKRRQETLDAAAAATILQSYLDSLGRGKQ